MTASRNAWVVTLLLASGCYEWAPIAALHVTRGHPVHVSRVRDESQDLSLSDVRVTTRRVRGVTPAEWVVSRPITPSTEYLRTTNGARIAGTTVGVVLAAVGVVATVVGVVALAAGPIGPIGGTHGP